MCVCVCVCVCALRTHNIYTLAQSAGAVEYSDIFSTED